MTSEHQKVNLKVLYKDTLPRTAFARYLEQPFEISLLNEKSTLTSVASF